VNTRLQVEHPVSEEVTGIDLVREMFRIADGEPLGYDDPPARGHSIEFRVNAEDPAHRFLPAPGTITVFRPPSGPGVRLDSGYAAGMTVPQVFDSLIAKLIVTGASRAQALQRAARALGEFENSPLFDERERAALRFAAKFKSGDDGVDSDEAYADIKRHFTEEEIIELALLCAETDGVGKFARSLQMRTWDEACELQPELRQSAENAAASR